ncbi:MAG: A/G-specific adenine glycosylase [Corynebacterium glucuronolyticum]|nr:A/G-specific adenine glycosylase [Corynebacterium glucuronolyticum]MDD7587254.1 A/G-specific adenine glycosylase [Mycobacteriaceae bacterium]MDY5834673.1 A/G-specific adenine glycosylase [Corynebacterium glucuronolyticum]
MEFDYLPLISWYRINGRDLPWRKEGTSPWAVLVSEVMSQQTPVNRVIPAWRAWMEKWPTPQDLAKADKADVLRAWGRLGYPRRALWLQQAAQQMGEEVPRSVDKLLELPGIGDYTARAVACFAYGEPVPVVDVNVRRVHYRLFDATYLTPPARKADLARLSAPKPELSVALMELGALVCTATNPRCEECPLADQCAWMAAGKPMPSEAEQAEKKKRVQKFEGTDRQVRGKIMALLRDADEPLASIDHAWPDAAQRSRALYSLLEDGLAEQLPDGRFSLPR